MTTLERLEKIEQDVKSLLVAMGSLGSSTQQPDKNWSERLEQAINSQLQQVHTFNQLVAQRQMALEQTVTSLAKTLSCTVDELESTGSITGEAVMTRLRVLDESSEKNRIDQMVKLNLIKESLLTTDESIIVISQKLLENGTEKTIADFRVIEMPSNLTPQDVKTMFLGKTVGDSVEESFDNQTLVSTIQKVYTLTQDGSLKNDLQETAAGG